jgi:hypothetical protein
MPKLSSSKWEPGAITGSTVTNLNLSSRFFVDNEWKYLCLNQYNHQIQKWTKKEDYGQLLQEEMARVQP